LTPLNPAEIEIRTELRKHVELLAGSIGGRSIGRYDGLRRAAEYIEHTSGALGLKPARQTYRVRNTDVWNIESEIKGSQKPAEIVIIGAHYDTAAGFPGANDNASGVAAMLDLAHQFRGRTPRRTVRWVAFVNEEPPYFQSPEMGSLVYANRCKERKEDITAMLSLETIGYYTNAPGSQKYPLRLHPFYPDVGNFIGFVANPSSAWLLRECLKSFRAATRFPCEGLAAPAGIAGLGWSDHWSFWENGYHGVMVTDTAPFRYPHYHTPDDTPDKLDYDSTAQVVFGLSRIVEDLAYR
jgi:Zn-dependent M28 family amino/carboxypeptidase